jgi:hypothetical protein
MTTFRRNTKNIVEDDTIVFVKVKSSENRKRKAAKQGGRKLQDEEPKQNDENKEKADEQKSIEDLVMKM